jgi:hypothetical protein
MKNRFYYIFAVFILFSNCTKSNEIAPNTDVTYQLFDYVDAYYNCTNSTFDSETHTPKNEIITIKELENGKKVIYNSDTFELYSTNSYAIKSGGPNLINFNNTKDTITISQKGGGVCLQHWWKHIGKRI